MKIRRVLKWGSIGLGALVAVGGLSAALWWYRPWMPAPEYTPVSELHAAIENVRTSTTLFPQPRDASVWPAWVGASAWASELIASATKYDPATSEYSTTEGIGALRSLACAEPSVVPLAREQLHSDEVAALLDELDRLANGPAPVPPASIAEADRINVRILSVDRDFRLSALTEYAEARLVLAGIDRDRAGALRSFRTLDRLVRPAAKATSMLDALVAAECWMIPRREIQMQMLEGGWTEPELAELDRLCREGMPDLAGWREIVAAALAVEKAMYTSGQMVGPRLLLTSPRAARAFVHSWGEGLETRVGTVAWSVAPPGEYSPAPLGWLDKTLSEAAEGPSETPASFTRKYWGLEHRLALRTRNHFLVALGTRVMIAIQRHQLRTGALPASLAEIPADLWSGSVPPLEAYEYRANPDGTFHLAVSGPGKPELRILTMPRTEYMKPRPSPFDSDSDSN